MVNEVIPESNPTGYKTEMTTSGLTGNGGTSVGNVEVQLNFSTLTSDGFIGDLYGYLVFQSADGSTTRSVLLNRVGRDDAPSFGYESTATSITLSGNLAMGYANMRTDVAGIAQTPRLERSGQRRPHLDLRHHATLLAHQHRDEIARLVTDGSFDAIRSTRAAPHFELPA